MREIKFRAWDTKRKKMWSAEEMGEDQLTLMPDGRGFININGTSTRLSQFCPHLIPMQFTGLKDKNGKKEVYEDSIVRVYFGDLPSTLTAIAQIIYLENECRFVAKGIGKDKGKGPWTIDPKRIEIIGNIHQHPKLLEQDNGK